MTKKQAITILQTLIHGDADCRCGNMTIGNDELEALGIAIVALEEDDDE